jgi:hypothetical protein
MAVAIARQPRSDPVIQFTVFIPNRIGRLHEVVRRLSERAVHILALTVLDTTDSTILRLIVDDPDAARALLEEHAFAFTETAVVVVEMQGERQLRDVLAALLEAELNIHYTYPFLTRPGGKSALVLNVEHPEVAVESLRRNLFPVLYQGDISR